MLDFADGPAVSDLPDSHDGRGDTQNCVNIGDVDVRDDIRRVLNVENHVDVDVVSDRHLDLGAAEMVNENIGLHDSHEENYVDRNAALDGNLSLDGAPQDATVNDGYDFDIGVDMNEIGKACDEARDMVVALHDYCSLWVTALEIESSAQLVMFVLEVGSDREK